MNMIDKKFKNLVDEIKMLSEKELYHRIRVKFEEIPDETKQSCMYFFNQFDYWGRLDIENKHYQEIELKAEELYHHIDDFDWLYQHLGDYRSKELLYSILNNWYQYDFITTNKTREYLYDDYFDLDLVKCNQEEVIVDLGAYTGDTILSYFKNYGEDCYKKIYCYEITSNTFDILKENLKDYPNIEYRQKGIGDQIGKMNVESNSSSESANTLKIDENGVLAITTLDDDITESITLIKADIEGYEQKAIRGAKNHIINDHPKLLISVYHHNEDLWKIPRMIYDLSKEYKFYLRYSGSPIYPTEITLIAI